MKLVRGFSLIELMIVVAIIGILSQIALPQYRDYVTRGKISEAVAELSTMRGKLEQYFLDNRTYVGACAAGTVAPLPAGKYFTYACTLGATTYTVTATGAAAEGMSGFTYTINDTNVRATTSVPAGWTANATCWVTRKGGSC
ncbi:MAG: prepilin-type N-terminal cleavage/methylation domain-containing protein [Sterolibacteriaceae bacterium MAG5]|nr:prepilin-type N-terminal cleavage/methylation domain-containing protein [Candidatus Nitricoxidireducens bremensis]